MIFFIAGILQKNMFFVIPIHFRTYTKHFRRFLTSFWSSAEQRWFRENQRWTALKQRWSALVFLTHSETALISAEIFEISETALFSADLLWDFNPGNKYENLWSSSSDWVNRSTITFTFSNITLTYWTNFCCCGENIQITCMLNFGIFHVL